MEVLSFGQTATRIYGEIEEGKCYQLEGLYVKINNKKFSSVKSDYQLNCSDQVKLTLLEDDNSIKTYNFDFTKISDIKDLGAETLVDVYGKVIDIGEKNTISTKFGDKDLRRVYIADDSNTKIEISLWGKYAEINFINGDYVVFKGVKVNEYQGSKSLYFSDSSIIVVDPAIPEKAELEIFFNMNESKNFNTLVGESNYDVEKINFLDKAVNSFNIYSDDIKIPLFKIKAVITNIFHSEKNWYLSCKSCKKKVTDETGLVCGACQNKNSEPIYTYVLSVRVRDSSSEFFVDIFSSVAEKLFGMNCNEYRQLVLDGDTNRLNEISNQFLYKDVLLVVGPKVHMFNNEIRRKLNLLRFEFCTVEKEQNRLVNLLDGILIK